MAEAPPPLSPPRKGEGDGAAPRSLTSKLSADGSCLSLPLAGRGQGWECFMAAAARLRHTRHPHGEPVEPCAANTVPALVVRQAHHESHEREHEGTGGNEKNLAPSPLTGLTSPSNRADG